MGAYEARWTERRPAEDYYRILNPDGTLLGKPPDRGDDEFRAWYRALAGSRLFDTLILRMQRRGELSVTGNSLGEEAIGVGAAAALQPGDWCFPSYRQMSALLYWGFPVDGMVAALMGAPPEHIAAHLPDAGPAPPVHVVPYTVFLGASIPHAAGCAIADQLNRRRTVTLAFVGEGATSEGDFYEGANVAGVFNAPLVIIVQNNQWCISVPAHRQTAARTFADKALAVGFRQSRVDGNDVFAVYEKTREAVEHARAGRGATLIEAVTYRVADHNTSDSATIYRGEEEVAYWKARDPVERMARYLQRAGLLAEEVRRRMLEADEQEMRAAIQRARAVPPPPAPLLFAHHLLGEPSWGIRRQQAELAAELEERNPFLSRDDEDA